MKNIFTFRNLRNGWFLPILIGILLITQSCTSTDFARKSALEKNRKIWNESGIKDYKMKINISQQGHGTPVGEFLITVRKGKAVSIIRPETPKVDLSDSWIFDRFDTIDKIFIIIEGFVNSNSENRTAEHLEYDQKLGYPKKISFNFDPESLHGGFYFEVEKFEILP